MSGKTSRSSAGPAEGPADFTKKKEEEKAVRKNEEAKEYPMAYIYTVPEEFRRLSVVIEENQFKYVKLPKKFFNKIKLLFYKKWEEILVKIDEANTAQKKYTIECYKKWGYDVIGDFPDILDIKAGGIILHTKDNITKITGGFTFKTYMYATFGIRLKEYSGGYLIEAPASVEYLIELLKENGCEFPDMD